MTPVLHVIDADADAALLQSLDELRGGLRAVSEPFVLCSINGPAAARAERWLGGRVLRAELRGRAFSVCRLGTVARETGAKLLHAWGVEAALACAARLPETPLLLTVHDAQTLTDAARWVRKFPTDATAVAPHAEAARRLVNAGLAREWVTVVPPWLERRSPHPAEQRGAAPEPRGQGGPVVLLHGPPSRVGGQFHGMWTAAVLRQVHKDLRLVMPYPSHEANRLLRLAEHTRIPNLLTAPDPALNWADLLKDADLFLVPAVDEIHIAPMLAAMAAGLPIAASKLPGVCEWIDDEREGLLFPPGDAKTAARQVLRLLDDPALCTRLGENARQRAAEADPPARAAERYTRIYHNLVSGRPPAA